jgi:hypothetical protein
MDMKREFWKCSKVLLVLFLVLSSGSCARTSSEELNRAFEQMWGPIFDGTLLLHTDKAQYTHDEVVDMRVENNTGATLYFPDQSFAVEGFRYNKSTRQWEPYQLFGGVGDPREKQVEPGAWLMKDVSYPLDTYLMPIEDGETYEIRLLVIGYSEPLEQGGGVRHGAYTDIEVSAR